MVSSRIAHIPLRSSIASLTAATVPRTKFLCHYRIGDLSQPSDVDIQNPYHAGSNDVDIIVKEQLNSKTRRSIVADAWLGSVHGARVNTNP